MQADPARGAIHLFGKKRHVAHAKSHQGQAKEPPPQPVQPAVMDQRHRHCPQRRHHHHQRLVLHLGILLRPLFHQVVARARQHHDPDRGEQAHGEYQDI
jgi:hypothetical protein